MNTTGPLFHGAPIWLTLPFALIAAGIVFALLILWWGARLAARRRDAREEIEEYNEEQFAEPPARSITPPVAPAPPPLAEPVIAPPAPVEAPAPEPVAEAPAPVPVAEPAPQPVAAPIAEIAPMPPAPTVEEAPAPEPLADEPIAAAAPLDASPASLASDLAEPAHVEPAPVAPAPAAPATDELTRMKGVGPRLAEKLNSVGITSFAQLAALTPEEADALDAKLGDFQGRIHRDRWIEQAGFLAKHDIAGFEAVFGKL
ncbi:helix-hairpin-helix domain-containing protein [Sphingomonas sp. KR3-1]|uniref:helix-hairpin-helix domain-containing protein n=1 Tax=Sphingomonas sp. KR3-1 TaxID=3156611 RepID=UPI0032B5C51F